MSGRHAGIVAPIRLGNAQRRWLMMSIGLLWGSGVLWLVLRYFLRPQGEFGEMTHPLESWCLRVHGLAMMLALLAVGSLLSQHLLRAWQLRKNRRWGAGLTAVLVWLALSGYALYYFAMDGWQNWLAMTHWLPGLLLPVLLIVHVWRGKRRRVQVARTAEAKRATAA